MDQVQMYARAKEVMDENFGHVIEMSVASAANGLVNVRDVNAIYRDGKFYVLSRVGNSLMQQIVVSPAVGLCHGSHNMQGTARSLGHPLDPANAALRKFLKKEFSLNYGEYVTESNPDMRIVEITVTTAETFTRYHRYNIDFVNHTVSRDHTEPLFVYR